MFSVLAIATVLEYGRLMDFVLIANVRVKILILVSDILRAVLQHIMRPIVMQFL